MSTRRKTRVPDPSPPRTRPSRSPARTRKISPARKSPPARQIAPKPKSPARKSPSRKLTSKYPARKSPARTVREAVEPLEPEPKILVPRSPAKRRGIQTDVTERFDAISAIYRSTRSKRTDYTVKDAIYSLRESTPDNNGISEVFGLKNRNSADEAPYTPRRSSRLREFIDVVPSLPDIRRSVSKSISKNSRTPSKSVSKSLDNYSDEESSHDDNPKEIQFSTKSSRKLSTPLRTSVSSFTQLARQWEFGGRIGTATLILLIPLMVISILASCMKSCSIYTLLNFSPFKYLSLWLSLPTSALIAAQILIQAILAIVPGSISDGMDYTGKKRCFNALTSSIIVVPLVFLLDYWKFIDKDLILQQYFKLATASYIFAVLLSMALYLKSSKLEKEKLNQYARTGYLLYDFFLGREIHPSFGSLNVKIWMSRICNINTLILALFIFTSSIKIQWTGTEDITLDNIIQLIGKVHYEISNPTAVVFSIMQIVYILIYIVKEYRVTSTFYWHSEGVGYLQLVSSALYPYYFTTLSKHISDTSLSLPTYVLIIASVLFSIGFWLMHISNDVKYEFRRDPLQLSSACLESMITFNGKRLITSHVWGVLRHPNYAGDILMHIALAIPGLLSGEIIAASPALITIMVLLHRLPSNDDLETSNYGICDDRRIIDLKYFLQELKKISSHSTVFGCSMNNLELIGEKRLGLLSSLKFKCSMCNVVLKINTSKPRPTKNLNLNTAVVTSAAVTGVGYTQLQEIFTSVNIPFLSEKYYKKLNDQVDDEWEKVATVHMEAAAAREKQCAIDEGRVNEDGIPIIEVIVDGCWAKRTYKKNYSSLSGAAAIIGKKFGEVLYAGVKNKYCCVCIRAKNKQATPKEHRCFKNYTGASTNMESEILLEGFKQSLDMYGLIYGKMVADGDASTYSKILQARPYLNYTVEKIECRNHLLRNLCNKLQALIKDSKYQLKQRKYLSTQRILAIRKVICSSIKYLKQTSDSKSKQINDLYVAITNSYNHAFGSHNDCKDFYCGSKKESEDITLILKNTALETQIKMIIGSTAANARSLIEDVDSNRCEQFNAIIAKCVGGKRVNFCQRRSYQTRCATAVVSFNTKRPIYNLQKSILGVSPMSSTKKLELLKLKRGRLRSKTRRRKLVFLNNEKKTEDENYGENCLKPDLLIEDFERLKGTFLDKLKKTDEELVNIERETILQSDSSKWLEIRRNLITASNFGKVVNKRSTTSGTLVKSLLYSKNISEIASIQHGRINEKNAITQLELQENIKISPCGLFIDKNNPFLGATPDGVIDENRILEIKCPISGFRSSLEEAVQNRKITFWNRNYVINKKHQWYLQVQGQLNITGRKECLFAVWTGTNKHIKTELIKCDENLWKNIMVPKLKKFYMESMLPEILDPRRTRNMPLRDIKCPQTISKTTIKKRKNCQINSEATQSTQATKVQKTQEQQITVNYKYM